MKIACICAKCGNHFMQEEDDLCIEFDFRNNNISFICRNKNCKHENIMKIASWKDVQKHSPLPRISLM